MKTQEMDCTSYEVQYKTKNGKKMCRAFVGDDKAILEEVVRTLEARDDIRYLAVTVSQSHVTLFD